MTHRPDRYESVQAHSVVIPRDLFGIGLFVHFSLTGDPPRVRLDPVFGDAGPRGLYAYPIEAGVHMTFGANRAFAFVLSPVGSVLDSRRYTPSDMDMDMARIAGVVGHAHVQQALAKQQRAIGKGRLDRRYTTPFGTVYYVVSKYIRPELEDEESPVQWSDGERVEDPLAASEIWQAIGYDVLVDWQGAIYSSEPNQAVFLNNKAFAVVDVLAGELA